MATVPDWPATDHSKFTDEMPLGSLTAALIVTVRADLSGGHGTPGISKVQMRFGLAETLVIDGPVRSGDVVVVVVVGLVVVGDDGEVVVVTEPPPLTVVVGEGSSGIVVESEPGIRVLGCQSRSG